MLHRPINGTSEDQKTPDREGLDREDLDRLIATVRTIAAELAPDIAAAESDGVYPRAHLDRLRRAGLFGLTAPVRFGGQGRGLADTAEVIREIGKSDPSAALILIMHYATLACLHDTNWPIPVAEKVLRAGATEGALINALRVEPDLGTPMRGGLPATTATRQPDGGWRLSGRKIYSTGSEGLSWGIVWARTDEDLPRVGQFLVPLGAKGVEILPVWDTLGLRSSSSHEVVFNQVALPEAYAVDLRAPDAWASRNDGMSLWISLLISALYTGVAEAARDWIVGFLKSRVPANLGRPLSELPRQQEAVGAIEALLAVNLRLIRSAAAEVDAGLPLSATDTGILKHTTTENAISAVERALKLAGNHAISRRNPIERHFRDVLCGRIHSPQEDTVLVGAGRRALGL